MKVLITSGGTTEPIDSVRGISNFATGGLGKLTAERFLEDGHEVILLAGDKAVLPQANQRLKIITIMGTENLYKEMKRCVPLVDVVVHSMAVSDYRPLYMTGLENFPSVLTEQDLLNFHPHHAKKISSKSNYQIMLLEKTPKIISFIKTWNPHVLLFGFKLLAGVEKQELLDVAKEKLISTRADFIIANDLENIKNSQHKAFIVSTDSMEELHTKSEIADKILSVSKTYYS